MNIILLYFSRGQDNMAVNGLISIGTGAMAAFIATPTDVIQYYNA